MTVGADRAHKGPAVLTMTLALVAVTDSVVIVIPVTGSVKLWPTSRKASVSRNRLPGHIEQVAAIRVGVRGQVEKDAGPGQVGVPADIPAQLDEERLAGGAPRDVQRLGAGAREFVGVKGIGPARQDGRDRR